MKIRDKKLIELLDDGNIWAFIKSDKQPNKPAGEDRFREQLKELSIDSKSIFLIHRGLSADQRKYPLSYKRSMDLLKTFLFKYWFESNQKSSRQFCDYLSPESSQVQCSISSVSPEQAARRLDFFGALAGKTSRIEPSCLPETGCYSMQSLLNYLSSPDKSESGWNHIQSSFIWYLPTAANLLRVQLQKDGLYSSSENKN